MKYQISDFRFQNFRATRGQALIETVIALVALLAVFAALVELARLGRARTEALMQARREAGEHALAPAYSQPNPEARFIYQWGEGGDDRSYSADDTVWTAVSDPVYDALLAPAHPGDLAMRVPGNALSNLQDLDPVVEGFDFVKGWNAASTIELLPVTRRLLYDEEHIRITAEAWLTWAREVP